MAKVVSTHARHVTSDVTSSETADASSAEAADVTSAEAADVTSAEAAHVATAKPTTVATTTATAASLCTRGKKAPGKHRGCQNRHHSSSHDILHLVGRTCRHRTVARRWFSAR